MSELNETLTRLKHEHVFLGDNHERNERRTWIVIGLTATMMVAEITAGTIYGSMALVADGWHMATHAAAMLITALAYLYSRKHSKNPRFTFGTGKLGDLAGFASAIVLAIIAILIGWESLVRLANPIAISFPQAITVAVLGLFINLLCAWLLKEDHSHHHHHHHSSHSHDHDHATHGQDNNLRAAYFHVLADALTSLLAIFALTAGSMFGWISLDPIMGIVGALIIARWSWGLMKDAGGALIDYIPQEETRHERIRQALETDTDKITDLHIWKLGPGHLGVIISLISKAPKPPSAYSKKLKHISGLSHITIEVNPQ